jgi:hypothetical protein
MAVRDCSNMAASIRVWIDASIDQKVETTPTENPSFEPLAWQLFFAQFVRNPKPPNLDQSLFTWRPDAQALYPA